MSTRLLCYRYSYSSASSVYDLIENGMPEIQIRVPQKERKFNEDSTQLGTELDSVEGTSTLNSNFSKDSSSSGGKSVQKRNIENNQKKSWPKN